MLRKEENYMVGSTRKSDVIIKPKIEVLRLEMGGGEEGRGSQLKKTQKRSIPTNGEASSSFLSLFLGYSCFQSSRGKGGRGKGRGKMHRDICSRFRGPGGGKRAFLQSDLCFF